MFLNQCAECSQERLTSHRYTASLNDNTRDGMNTTAGRTQDPVKPTQLAGIETFLRPGYPISIGDCESLLKVELDYGQSKKSTINGTAAEKSTLEKLTESQDNRSTPQHEYDVCITCNKPLSKQVVVHNRTFSSDRGDKLFMQKGNLLIHKGETYFTCTTRQKITIVYTYSYPNS